jgi:hypothetical protein
VLAWNDNGVASFDLVRHHLANDSVFLYAFDLIELNGDDLRGRPCVGQSVTARPNPGRRGKSRPVAATAGRG